MKDINREQVIEFNRGLTKMFDDIEAGVYDLGAEAYSLSETKYDGVYERMQDIKKAMYALKKELYDLSEPKNSCEECGGIGHTIGFLGSKKVTYPCSKGC